MIRPIQYLRALAALMVVWHHSLGQVTGLSGFIHVREFGTSGVDLFFVISGFIMLVTTTEKPLTPWRFFKLRIVRVVPLYWFVTLLMIACAAVAPSLLKTLEFTPEAIVKSLLFVPYYSISFPTFIWPVLVPGWTLNYEMFFYALFAVSLAIPQRFRLGWLLSMLILLVLTGFAAKPTNAIEVVYTSPLLLEFGAGAAIGWMWLEKKLQLGLAVSIAAMALGGLLLYKRDELLGCSQSVGAILMVAGCLNGTIRGMHNRLLLMLGDASYSIYLTHIFTLGALRVIWVRAVPHASFTVAMAFMAVALAVCAAAGWLCYRCVEMPMTAQLRKLVRGGPNLQLPESH